MMNFLKQVSNVLMMPIRLVVGILADLGRLVLKLFGKIAGYIYEACDICVRHVIFFCRDLHVRFHFWLTQANKGRVMKLGGVMGLILLVIGGFVYVFSFYFFVVPPGDTAVVTRFGRYNRSITSGLGFRLPTVERYFIVANETIREERFGFRQGPSQESQLPFIIDPQERYVKDVYEPRILKSEQDPGKYFSEKGHIADELNRNQRMTHDYLRRHYAPPVNKSSPTMIKQAINARDKVASEQQQHGADSHGKFPYHDERQILTGDMSIVYMEWTLQYYINDVKSYLFNSRDVQRNIRDISLAVMNEVIGEYHIDGIITNMRQRIEKEVGRRIQYVLDEYKLGVKVTQVIILNALPPSEVEGAFNEVNRAVQDMEKLKYDAEIQYLKTIPKAKGQADRVILEAKAYAIEIINKARGEAGQFLKINKEYLKAKQITEDRLYIETMEKVLKETPNIIMDNNVNGLLPIFMGTGKEKGRSMKEALQGRFSRNIGKTDFDPEPGEMASKIKPLFPKDRIDIATERVENPLVGQVKQATVGKVNEPVVTKPSGALSVAKPTETPVLPKNSTQVPSTNAEVP